MELDPIDFFPRYDSHYIARRNARRFNTLISIFTHFLAMIIAVGICAGAFYYYDRYVKTGLDSIFVQNTARPKIDNEKSKIDQVVKDMGKLKEEIEETVIWRKHLDGLFSKIYLDKEAIVDGKIEKAIDLYDADRVGLFDYASVYAYGSVVSTPETLPYPANKSISYFNLVNVDILSDPELILQPSNLPGSCFAFHGSKGRIRIKLGSPIKIRAVSLDHIRLLENASSAPKYFKVIGLLDPMDPDGVLLGSFFYDLKGRPYQTFKIEDKFANYPYEYVEVSILSNHGKEDFTCVYRFRVHNLYRTP